MKLDKVIDLRESMERKENLHSIQIDNDLLIERKPDSEKIIKKQPRAEYMEYIKKIKQMKREQHVEKVKKMFERTYGIGSFEAMYGK
jgi:hypothetical protein